MNRFIVRNKPGNGQVLYTPRLENINSLFHETSLFLVLPTYVEIILMRLLLCRISAKIHGMDFGELSLMGTTLRVSNQPGMGDSAKITDQEIPGFDVVLL